MRPSLKTEYAGLCLQNVPGTSLLFGDDLQQQLNNVKASNKISQTSANANKSQRSGYKGNSSDSGKNRSSDKYYNRPFHSQSHWRSRGVSTVESLESKVVHSFIPSSATTNLCLKCIEHSIECLESCRFARIA